MINIKFLSIGERHYTEWKIEKNKNYKKRLKKKDYKDKGKTTIRYCFKFCFYVCIFVCYVLWIFILEINVPPPLSVFWFSLFLSCFIYFYIYIVIYLSCKMTKVYTTRISRFFKRLRPPKSFSFAATQSMVRLLFLTRK